MDFIEKMGNEELITEFERIINRMHSYSASNEPEYKDKLKSEILRRLAKNESKQLI